MRELLKLIGERKSDKLLQHKDFADGIHELIRKGYVVVKDENFLLTAKGELARKEGLKPDDSDQVQLKRNNLNKIINEGSNKTSTDEPKSVFFLIVAFFIFILKLLPTQKISKFTTKKNRGIK